MHQSMKRVSQFLPYLQVPLIDGGWTVYRGWFEMSGNFGPGSQNNPEHDFKSSPRMELSDTKLVSSQNYMQSSIE
jgi:hypothetical protein